MIAYLPIAGGHITLAERFVDPAFSFAMGWNYWYISGYIEFAYSWRLTFHSPFRYNWVIVLPAELSAAAILIGFWNKTVNPAVWITICMVVVVAINLMGAGERFHIIQICVSYLSLHLYRCLWRSWIYFCASVDTSSHMIRIWRPAGCIAPSKLSLSPVLSF